MLHEGEPGAEDFAARLEADGVPVERVRLAARVRPAGVRAHPADARGATGPTSFTRISSTPTSTGSPRAGSHACPALVSTKHGFNAFRDGKAFAAADRAVASLADVHIAISAGLARYLAESEGFDAASFEVVHYGIEAGPEPPPLPGAPRLAIVGRLIPIKGHDVLLRAVARARERLPGLTLEIAGDGELEQELRATAARLGLDDAVTFLGRVAPVAPVLERAEVVVVPSFGEGFGMVALEAMERGRPVIASAVGGLPGDRRRRPHRAARAAGRRRGSRRGDRRSSRTTRRAPRRWARPAVRARSRSSRRSAAPSGSRRSTGRRWRRPASGASAGAPRRARARTPRAARARSPTGRGSAPSRRTPSP